MPIGSTPSLATMLGTSFTFWKNISNQRSRFMPFQITRSADCALTMSSGVGW